jgi:hypothetical protein
MLRLRHVNTNLPRSRPIWIGLKEPAASKPKPPAIFTIWAATGQGTTASIAWRQ